MNEIRRLTDIRLPADFRGGVLCPGDDKYEAARGVFSMRWDQNHPAVILRPVDADDLACLMRHMSANGIPVALRAGGHSADGSSMPDGEVVIDLRGFREISVDPVTKIVRAGAGIFLGDLDKATQEYGLVVPAGTVSTTGIAGLTLGGGVGYNMRRFGATVDSLLSCDVVTVDGRQLRASKTENPDLFWALCGAGANFAVVTAFEFQAYAVGPMVAAGDVLFPLEQAAAVLAKLRVFMATAPRELTVIGALVPTPHMPGIPPEYYDVYMLSLLVVYTGDLQNLSALTAKVATLGTPAAVVVGPAPWVAVNSMLDASAPYGRRSHNRGGYLTALTDSAIDAIVQSAIRAAALGAPGPSTVQNVWFMNGAITEDFEEDSVAFSREGAGIFWEGVAQWDDPADDARFVAWAESACAALQPEMRANGYVNLTTDQGPEWLRGLYGSKTKYQRLVAAKRKWDPQNLLRFNKNIKP